MLQKLISHNSDLNRLHTEGYKLQIKEAFLIVSNIPYLNFNKEIQYGELISELTLAGDKTSRPSTHTVFFIGDYPCDHKGNPIKAIECEEHLSKEKQKQIAGKQIHYTFSSKPEGGYQDYFEKIETYIKIISHPAESIDPLVTAKVYATITPHSEDSVFHYLDTNLSKSGISELSKKFYDHKVAIIGLGGTGSYVLDLVSKTPVKEIHLFDGDVFLSHNAFRAPGAASLNRLREELKKVDYLKSVYSNIHKNIYAHCSNIKKSNFEKLLNMNFVFICIDKGSIKKQLFNFLIQNEIYFIDVGVGIIRENKKLLGHVRVNLGSPTYNSHLKDNISFLDDMDDDYSTNIQIADVNALNASLAVIKWKKVLGFYSDYEKEHTSVYTINTHSLDNQDYDNKT